MTQRPDINQLSTDQLRALATELMDSLDAKDQALGRKERELVRRNAIIEKLTHEVAILKRHKFARRSEQLDAVQGKLLDELIDSDLAAIEAELDQEMTEERRAARPKQKPKRTPLPPELPCTLIHHEPDNILCQCGCQLKRIGEDVSEKLDYVPGEFTVERHTRGKWACNQCETLVQAPVPPQVIDKGIPTAGLLAQVLVAKYADHLPLYRQERIFGRAGLEIPRSAVHQWMLAHRQKVPDGSGTAKALDYSLKRWEALTRYLDDGAVPIDNNWVENQIRPWALGRSNWLFAGSLRSGRRAAAVMTLIQSAKLNGHDPYAYLKDVLTRLPTQKNNAIDELLPHNWKPAIPDKV